MRTEILKYLLHGWIDGWMNWLMNCDLTSFLKVFQSYQDNVEMIMKDCVHWNPVRGWKDFRLHRVSNPCRTAKSAGQHLTHWANGAPLLHTAGIIANRRTGKVYASSIEVLCQNYTPYLYSFFFYLPVYCFIHWFINYLSFFFECFYECVWWSNIAGPFVLDIWSVLLIWNIVGRGPTVLAVGAGVGCLDFFFLVYHLSSFSLSLGAGLI